MNKKIIVICEGQSEQVFCDKLLKSHFATLDIDLAYPLPMQSGGGIVPWRHLKKQIELHHQTEPATFITTFIDYYGLTPSLRFPEWANAQNILDLPNRMQRLESAMGNALSPPVAGQFIPYIQLHEFEALVLADRTAFSTYYEPAEYDSNRLDALCALLPESVNDGPNTAPSKRLESIIPRYHKNGDGPELASLATLPVIRRRCPRFHNWLAQLESI